MRLGLLEDQVAARVEVGGTDVVGELEWLVGQHPLREGLWASLLTALYRAGRQADALAAYRRIRRLLDEELGVEPGPQLRELEQLILRQSRALDPADPQPRPELRVGNLPSLSAPLVGRADDLAALGRLLDGHRLVTVVGPAGVGKTRTAVEAARARDLPGGSWLVRLDAADVRTPLPRLVAETLRLPDGEQALAGRLAGTPTLLVLDNCEHLVDDVAELTVGLLDTAPPLRVLATSQVPLAVDGETVHPLAPLTLPDSVALFADRAARSRRRFALDEDSAPTVEAVCRSLDGLPLAIELAAARVKSLSVRDIARRLDDRFALLRDPGSRRPERRRALAAAIGWSYDLLFPDDQRGLWALSVFADGAPAEAAEHVLTALGVPDRSAVDVFDRLADRCMLTVEVTADGATRYRLLDSIRLFSLDRLERAGRVEDARAAHAGWFGAAADRCAATVRSAAQPDCLALARAERADVDAALAWTARHDPALGLRIAAGFGWTWVVQGDGTAGAGRIRAALDAAGPAAAPRERATALLLAGWLEASAGNVEQAQADLDAAGRLADAVADDRLRADVQRHLAFLRIQQGRPADVVTLAAASVAGYRRLGLPWETAAGLLLGAYGSIMLGDTSGATQAAEEAIQVLDPLGDAWGMVHAEAMLGAVAQAEHRLAAAEARLVRAVAVSEDLGFAGQAALHLTTLGRVRARSGQLAAAAGTLQRAIRAGTAAGDLRIVATARLHLARVLRRTGDATAAVALLADNARWYGSSGGGDGALLSRCLLAAAELDGDPAAAAGRLHAVLEEARAADDVEVQTLALDGLARAAAGQGDGRSAAELLLAADDLSVRIQHVLDPDDRLDAILARDLIR